MNSKKGSARSDNEPRGPQFNDEHDVLERIAEAKKNGWGEKLGSFFAAYRMQLLVTVVVAATIVIGLVAINVLAPQDNTTPTTAATEELNEPTENTDEPATSAPQGATSENGDITEQAQPGEGITHLARRALTKYTESSSAPLSAEQRIYAEDYLQNRIGSFSLEEGEKVTFAADDIAASVQQARELSEAQLQNLTQYTMVLSS